MFKTIKNQIIFVLLVQFLALFATTFTSLYLINLRQHDYLILSLAGQLQVMTRNLVTQSQHYLEQAPRDYGTYNRDVELYYKDLLMQIDSYNKIIESLNNRVISAELVAPPMPEETNASNSSKQTPLLTSRDEVLICKWDQPSRNQMSLTAKTWKEFHVELVMVLGDPNEPRLEAAAEFIVLNEQKLMTSIIELTNSFRTMMEEKLSQIQGLNQLTILILILISATVLFIILRKVLLPISKTVQGFKRVAHGDLTHQVPVSGKSEISSMVHSFNSLTQRISSLFRLTDKINQTDNMDATLKFVHEEFSTFFPIGWVGVLRSSSQNNTFHLDRSFGDPGFTISQREVFDIQGSVFARAISNDKPLSYSVTSKSDPVLSDDGFMQRLYDNSQHSYFYLPIINNNLETAVLVISSKQKNAYTIEHLEFLTNIGKQVAHSFEKTIGMESLVISTVKGLAGLAESRDPETGDHLFRMSHYSSFIAEALMKTDEYSTVIDSNYIRDILIFSPMHDIGKVGINDAILLKPGKLDENEFKEMQQHPVIGADVLRRCEAQMNALGRNVFTLGIEIAEAHHEKYNGTGYPKQLNGKQIPLSARIVAVADVFDALTSRRPYKEAWSVEKAIEAINKDSGHHFDPDVVKAFHEAMPSIMEIYEEHKHI